MKFLDLPPTQDAIVANKGLGWGSLLKMFRNPGGDEPASWGGRAKLGGGFKYSSFFQMGWNHQPVRYFYMKLLNISLE